LLLLDIFCRMFCVKKLHDGLYVATEFFFLSSCPPHNLLKLLRY
jgi:hypothetical protein